MECKQCCRPPEVAGDSSPPRPCRRVRARFSGQRGCSRRPSPDECRRWCWGNIECGGTSPGSGQGIRTSIVGEEEFETWEPRLAQSNSRQDYTAHPSGEQSSTMPRLDALLDALEEKTLNHEGHEVSRRVGASSCDLTSDLTSFVVRTQLQTVPDGAHSFERGCGMICRR